MSNKKKSFILHIDSLDILDDLTVNQAGFLFKAIKAYQNNEQIEIDDIVKLVFAPFKNQFIRDDVKYTQTCERRAIAGAKGGKQKVANASNCKQILANVAESNNDSKNDSNNDSKKEVTSRFTPPSVEEVFNYCNERCNGIDAQNFVDHYETNGWKRGNTKIKDWKACVRTWEKKSKTNTVVNESLKGKW